MADVLLLDFGASRIKGVRCAIDSGKVLVSAQFDSPIPSFGPNGEVELDPYLYVEAFDQLVTALGANTNTSAIWLCCEMHGVMLVDNFSRPATNYISWRDSRGSFRHTNDNESLLDTMVREHGEEYLTLTGMRLRAGLPALTLSQLLTSRSDLGIQPLRIATLSDWLLMAKGNPEPLGHISLQAGLGLIDIRSGQPALHLLASHPTNWSLSKTVSDLTAPIGHCQIGELHLPIFGGIGDFQVAMHGIAQSAEDTLAINLGTGSQVATRREMNVAPRGLEVRPAADHGFLTAITHIPCGRAIDVFAGFMDACGNRSRDSSLFWSIFKSLTPEDVLNSSLEIDLAVFGAANGFTGGGAVRGILEGNLSLQHWVASVARCWLQQYALAIDRIDPTGVSNCVAVGGGMSRRSSFVGPVLAELTGLDCRLNTPLTGEETLDGLLGLAMGTTFSTLPRGGAAND